MKGPWGQFIETQYRHQLASCCVRTIHAGEHTFMSIGLQRPLDQNLTCLTRYALPSMLLRDRADQLNVRTIERAGRHKPRRVVPIKGRFDRTARYETSPGTLRPTHPRSSRPLKPKLRGA